MSRKPLIENLERRTLCADFAAAVSFAPITARRVPGMLTDYGAEYAVRRGGLSYGWNADLTAQTVKRNLAPVPRNDTFIALKTGDVWNMGVENGTYKVFVVSGDPARVGDRLAVTVEGEVAVAGMTKTRKPYLEGGVTVDVTDGNITVAAAGAFGADRINYLAIESVSSTTPTPTTPNPAVVTSKISWRTGARQLTPRTEPESAVVDGKLYVFSGYGNGSATDYAGPGWAPNPSFERYDPATGNWSVVGNMPVPTTHAGVAVIGTDVWFAGGYTLRPGTNNRQDVGSTNVWIYHTTSNTWERGPSLPAKRASGGMAKIGNILYFVSGEPVDHVSVTTNLWALDLTNQSAGWKSKASIPEGRTHFGIAVVNNKIYVMGGQKNIDANASFLKTSYSYDPATNAWKRLADMPLARSHNSPNTIVIDNKIYLLGGEYKFNYELADVLRYDPATNTFANLTPLPAKRAAGSAAYIGGKLIFSGGKNNGFFSDTYIGTFV